MFYSEGGNGDSTVSSEADLLRFVPIVKAPLTWHEASSATVNLHRWLRWNVCLPVDELLPGGHLYSHTTKMPVSTWNFLELIQLCHVQCLESNRIGGGLYIWNVHMSIKCVTLTLLPFEKSGWHQDSCSTYSYQSALLTSILALEGNVKKY